MERKWKMIEQQELDRVQDLEASLDRTLEKARELEGVLGDVGETVRSLGLAELSETLEQSVEAVSSLGGKFDEAEYLYRKVPSLEELEECAEAASSLAGKLDDIGLLYKNAPSSDELEECAEAAIGLCKALEAANAEAERLPALDN
jgi:hypothetical protein